jgi:hypothetical protein
MNDEQLQAFYDELASAFWQEYFDIYLHLMMYGEWPRPDDEDSDGV